VEEMKSIIAKYKLQDKIIVENSIPELLALYKLSGIFTSLWIPDISGNLFTSIAENNLYEDIESIVSNYQFDAISAHYNMVSFMEKYFRKYNCHIWTNGLTSENDKQQIMNYASKSNIKVILVDYNINFLK
jgi:phosphoribosylanthranilate isomerase